VFIGNLVEDLLSLTKHFCTPKNFDFDRKTNAIFISLLLMLSIAPLHFMTEKLQHKLDQASDDLEGVKK
jgi:hypothetical protein